MINDLRYGIRMLLKNPGFTAVAVSALALGIGATTAIFSVVNSVLLRPLPYEESDRLVSVTTWFPSLNADFLASTEYIEWEQQNHVFEHFAAFPRNLGGTSIVLAGNEPLQIGTARVTSSLLATLRVQPLLGRGFLPDECRPGKGTVTILSHGLWLRRFGGDPAVLGKSITLDSQPYTIVGVLPSMFRFPQQVRVDALTPLPIHPVDAKHDEMYAWDAIGRLKPGVSLAQARAELETLFANTKARFPEIYRDDAQLRVVPLQERRIKDVRLALLVLLGAVGCVLLIACSNVANLLLARASARQREIAVRMALGAGRLRLVRQLLTESVLLGLLGCALGLFLAYGALKVFVQFAPEGIPRVEEVTVDGRVLTFAVMMSVLTGIIFGLVPAFAAARTHVQEALKQNASRGVAGTHRRLKSLLVSLELAVSLVLLITAGLLLKSLWRMQNYNIGFQRENVLVANIRLNGSHFQQGNREVFLRELTDRMSHIPGTLSLALTDSLPPYGGRSLTTFSREGRPLPELWHRGDNMVTRGVSSEYFHTLRIPLVKGRTFDITDRREAPRVGMINQTLARRYFPDEDPIGKRIDGPSEWKTIIGIVGDVRNGGLNGEVEAEMYVPYFLRPEDPALNLIVRTLADSPPVIARIRAELRDMDKQMFVNFSTMDQQISEMVSGPKFNTILVVTFAGLAMVLALVGIYGVMSYNVAQRTQAIGIRIALGAQRPDILRLVLGETLKWIFLGIGMGLVVAFASTRILSSLLYQVSVTDPETYVGVSLVLTLVALLACYVPLRRATKVDPMVALRYE